MKPQMFLLALITMIPAVLAASPAAADVSIIGAGRDDGNPPPPPPQSSFPNYVRVRSVSYAGSGCPAGSVSTNISPDYGSFSILWDSFIAETGPGIPLSASRKNCQLAIDLDFPQGWSYTVADVEYRGYVSLDRGVDATQSTAYYFQGQTSTARLSTTMRGPMSRDYVVRDTLGLSAQVWSPCGMQRALNINVQARVSNMGNSRGNGLITVESPVGSTLGGLRLQWRRCR